jgi:hypothetical protein
MKYINYKLSELKIIARNLHLKKYSKLNKEDLISLIKKYKNKLEKRGGSINNVLNSNNIDYIKNLYNPNNILNHRNILNFLIDKKINLPNWFNSIENKLWAGDADCVDLLNIIEKNGDYNIFYCLPESMQDPYSYIYINIEKLEKYYGKDKYLICLLDCNSENQVKRFEEIFENFFTEYTVKGHNFTLDINCISKILENEGIYNPGHGESKIVTIVEKSGNMKGLTKHISIKEMLSLPLNKQYIDNNTKIPIRVIMSGRSVISNNKFNNYANEITNNEILLEKNIYELYYSYVLNKFRLGKNGKELKNILEYLNNRFKNNKYFKVLSLFKIYNFLLKNFKETIPNNMICILDINGEKKDQFGFVIYYKKIEKNNLESFYNI